MSKNKQREVSRVAARKEMFKSGYIDGRRNKLFLWQKHPLLKHYKAGYVLGQTKYKKYATEVLNQEEELKEYNSILNRIKRFFLYFS